MMRRFDALTGRAFAPFACHGHPAAERVGVDRDGDGHWVGDERDADSDLADPSSTP